MNGFYRISALYWYKHKKKTYGAIVLYKQGDYYLVGISEELNFSGKKPSAEDVLHASIYTVSWFAEEFMLSLFRFHFIGTIECAADYHNRAGMLENEDTSLLLKNVGMSYTWKHENRSYALHGLIMNDLCTTKHLPKTFHQFGYSYYG